MAKVLLVQADASLRRLAEFSLQQEGFEVVTARDGKQSLQVAQREQPDAIVLDALMPVMDGCETCLRLKEIPTTAHIPILLLTDH
ncbi:MAG: response regulator, partial [Chloroflexi bacterium]|nr:response regulator [Chloroflexota bacterium]